MSDDVASTIHESLRRGRRRRAPPPPRSPPSVAAVAGPARTLNLKSKPETLNPNPKHKP
jgi:hypothetical protein